MDMLLGLDMLKRHQVTPVTLYDMTVTSRCSQSYLCLCVMVFGTVQV